MKSTLEAPPPVPPKGSSTGYQGGSLARQITSHDIQPIESLIAQRGRDEPLQEEEDRRQSRDLRQRGRTDTQETRIGSSTSKEEADAAQPRKDELVFTEEGVGQAPEWTFPDGGWRAWSVVLVSAVPSRSAKLSIVRMKHR